MAGASAPDERLVVSTLDDEWRTPMNIRRLLKYSCEGNILTIALRKLAAIGKIECRREDTGCPKKCSGGKLRGVRKLEFYRKVQ